MKARSLAVALFALAGVAVAPSLAAPFDLGPDEQVVTIVGTNDIHGGLSPTTKGGETLGGFEWFGGMVSAIRTHHAETYPGRSRVVLVDAGDAIQGTLLANFSEGRLVMQAMGLIGYDAVIAGNHGYDFGPVGWRQDLVKPGSRQDPLGALRAAAAAGGVPVLGANVRLEATGERLRDFPPYKLVPLGSGRNLALIGLENPLTPKITPPENVATLRFGDGVQDLVGLVAELTETDQADLFVVAFHEGDGKTGGLRKYLEALPRRPGGEPLIDAVIAGHSHTREQAMAAGIPYIQSLSGGTHFGMIQMVVGPEAKSPRLKVYRARTRLQAAIPIVPRPHRYLDQAVRPNARVAALLKKGRAEVAKIAGRKLGVAEIELTRTGGRLADSRMGNLLADKMRLAAKTEVALINSGDVRAGIAKGPVTYEELFQALPKNLRLVRLPKLPVEALVKNIQRSVRTCGRRGALQISGLKIDFSRDCTCPDSKKDADDGKAQVIRLTTSAGRVLYELVDGKAVVDPKPVSVATTDFVMAGGAGYPGFEERHARGRRVHLRDAIADQMTRARRVQGKEVERGRYRNLGPLRCAKSGARQARLNRLAKQRVRKR